MYDFVKTTSTNMKTTFHALYFTVLALFTTLTLTAQYTGTGPYCYEGGGLLINEVSNGPGGSVSEYIELVVVGAPTDPTAPVDLRGWIVDDNNITGGGQGTATGHISFGDCYAAVPPGSIIVIYNNESPNPVLPPNDPEDSDGDGSYIIPHNHPCMDACFSNPSGTNPLYCPCSDTAPSPVSWQVGLRNPGDVVQIRDACETVIHAISWGNVNLTPSVESAPVTFQISPNSQSGRLFRFAHIIDDNWNNPTNYETVPIAGQETPGQPNNTANSDFILDIANGVSVSNGTISDCRDTDAGDLFAPFDAPSTGPIQLCQGDDISAFGTDYSLPDENLPDAVGFTYEYGFILTLDNPPFYSFVDFNTTGDFDFSTLAPASYMVWGFSFIQTNGSLSVTDFLTSFVTSVEDILDYDNCGYHGDIDNLDFNGIPMQVIIFPGPTAFTPMNPLSACPDENGLALFDLTQLNDEINGGTGLPVNWFIDPSTTVPIGDPANYLTAAGTVYATVGTGLCASMPVEITINVFAPIEALLDLISPVSCAGSNDAILEVLTSGTPPFDFDWNIDALDGGNPAVSLGPGTYEVTVTSADGCTDFSSFTITEPTALVVNCEQTMPVSTIGGSDGSASVSIDGGTPPYDVEWTGPVSGSTSAAGTITLPVMGLSGGLYTIVVMDANGCIETCEVVIDAPECGFTIDATSGNVTCNGDGDGFIDLEITGTGNLPLEVLWNTGDNRLNLEDLEGGTYTVTVTDPGTCERTLTVEITEPDSLDLALAFSPPTCPGELDGTIILEAVTGGTAPFSLTINDELAGLLENFPLTLSNLDSGRYTLLIEDTNGCTITDELILIAPETITLELGDDDMIVLGDSLQLLPQVSFTPDTFFWTQVFPNNGQFQPFVRPTVTTTYELTVLSNTGCAVSDQITISVDPNRKVYIPNAFSPNNDGFNDRFTIYAGGNVRQISTMQIFDRWGELVFERDNFAFGDERFGWDGKFRGKAVNPGVFVYFAEIEYLDGRVLKLLKATSY
jgi:gliding motility-associated-like protein